VALVRRIVSAVKRGNRLRLLALSVLVVAVLVGTTGCYTKINGGGWMQSASGGGKANFAISDDGDKDAGGNFQIFVKGTYQDKAEGVSLRFDQALDDIDISDLFSTQNCADFTATYQSLNKTKPGSGTAKVRVCDNANLAEDGFVGDFVSIRLISGPLAPYHNEGPILGGNLQGLELFSF
jgi:hypothetical protein